jgi:anti-sigma regulatory factor (Ser/Thr protein kinase)
VDQTPDPRLVPVFLCHYVNTARIGGETMSKQWELTVDGCLENLATIADFVIKAAQASGLNKKATFEVQMAVDEACANVIKHGYGEEDKGTIALRCECAEGDFVVTIRDSASPFDPETVPQPDITCSLEKRKQGGLGLYFMRKLMDEVRFHFNSGGTELTMIKKECRTTGSET